MRIVCGTPYHLIVTSADVVHSFSVPSLNLKMDAIPGRLSHLFFILLRMEPLLGIVPNYAALEHRIMPIMIEVKDVGKQVSFVLVQYVVVAFRDKDLLFLFSIVSHYAYYCVLLVVRALVPRFMC